MSFQLHQRSSLDKPALHRQLQQDLTAVFEGERDFIANAANCAAILFQTLPDISWAGFYLLKGTDLVLGPFQGKPACVRIGPGRGVCGAAAAQQRTLVVSNVHEYPGHIACDSASNSEIVVPLLKEGRFLGVLDIDSPLFDRFDDLDAAALEAATTLLMDASLLPLP